MATITIKDVPKEVIEIYGTQVKYSEGIKFSSHKRESNLDIIDYWDDNEISNLGKVSTIVSNNF